MKALPLVTWEDKKRQHLYFDNKLKGLVYASEQMPGASLFSAT
jgi:hypothetical protein